MGELISNRCMDYYRNLKHLCYIMAFFGCYSFRNGPLSNITFLKTVSYIWCGFIFLCNLFGVLTITTAACIAFVQSAPSWIKIFMLNNICYILPNCINSIFGIFIAMRKDRLHSFFLEWKKLVGLQSDPLKRRKSKSYVVILGLFLGAVACTLLTTVVIYVCFEEN